MEGSIALQVVFKLMIYRNSNISMKVKPVALLGNAASNNVIKAGRKIC